MAEPGKTNGPEPALYLYLCVYYLVIYNICFRLSLFPDLNISQGNVAMPLRCSGKTNFVMNLSVQ